MGIKALNQSTGRKSRTSDPSTPTILIDASSPAGHKIIMRMLKDKKDIKADGVGIILDGDVQDETKTINIPPNEED